MSGTPGDNNDQYSGSGNSEIALIDMVILIFFLTGLNYIYDLFVSSSKHEEQQKRLTEFEEIIMSNELDMLELINLGVEKTQYYTRPFKSGLFKSQAEYHRFLLDKISQDQSKITALCRLSRKDLKPFVENGFSITKSWKFKVGRFKLFAKLLWVQNKNGLSEDDAACLLRLCSKVKYRAFSDIPGPVYSKMIEKLDKIGAPEGVMPLGLWLHKRICKFYAAPSKGISVSGVGAGAGSVLGAEESKAGPEEVAELEAAEAKAKAERIEVARLEADRVAKETAESKAKLEAEIRRLNEQAAGKRRAARALIPAVAPQPQNTAKKKPKPKGSIVSTKAVEVAPPFPKAPPSLSRVPSVVSRHIAAQGDKTPDYNTLVPSPRARQSGAGCGAGAGAGGEPGSIKPDASKEQAIAAALFGTETDKILNLVWNKAKSQVASLPSVTEIEKRIQLACAHWHLINLFSLIEKGYAVSTLRDSIVPLRDKLAHCYSMSENPFAKFANFQALREYVISTNSLERICSELGAQDLPMFAPKAVNDRIKAIKSIINTDAELTLADNPVLTAANQGLLLELAESSKISCTALSVFDDKLTRHARQVRNTIAHEPAYVPSADGDSLVSVSRKPRIDPGSKPLSDLSVEAYTANFYDTNVKPSLAPAVLAAAFAAVTSESKGADSPVSTPKAG